MTLPTTLLDDAEAQFAAWRDSPDYDGDTLRPRAQFYVDGECEAVVMFPAMDVQPMVKSLYDVAGTLGMLGDGIVVYNEIWLKTGVQVDDLELENYEHGDMALDPSSGQGLMVMVITPDRFDATVLPYTVADDGTLTYGKRIDMGGDGMMGRVPSVVREAIEDARPLHARIRAELDVVNKMCPPDEEPIGEGTIIRGAIAALGSRGEYVVAATEHLLEML
jgi:hypothetical protein